MRFTRRQGDITEALDDRYGKRLQSPNDVQRVFGQGPTIFLSASASAWWSAMALTSSGSAAQGEDSRRDAGLVGSEAIATGGSDVTTNHCRPVSCQPIPSSLRVGSVADRVLLCLLFRLFRAAERGTRWSGALGSAKEATPCRLLRRDSPRLMSSVSPAGWKAALNLLSARH